MMASPPPHPVQYLKILLITAFVAACCAAQWRLDRRLPPAALVEFLDLECPFCMQFHNDVFPEIRRRYVENGKLRFVVLNYPLPSHPYADPAAKLAVCAGLQGKYWEVFDAFLSTPHVGTPGEITQIAKDNRLDQKELDQCLQNDTTKRALKQEGG